MGWPYWSRPDAVNCCWPPAGTEALAGATLIVVRTGGAAVTDTLAVPVTVPLAAVTLNGPPALEPARNKPVASIVPPPPPTSRRSPRWAGRTGRGRTP